MKAQILAQGRTADFGPTSVKPFGYRSKEQVLRQKIAGAVVVIGIPVALNLVLGLLA
jgi:hypothetical protein